uniref:Uncharacterized protein n=1 Tax=Arundo donax TaxID=35708 RepID=A0A0A9GFB7_ARUDO
MWLVAMMGPGGIRELF